MIGKHIEIFLVEGVPGGVTTADSQVFTLTNAKPITISAAGS